MYKYSYSTGRCEECFGDPGTSKQALRQKSWSYYGSIDRSASCSTVLVYFALFFYYILILTDITG